MNDKMVLAVNLRRMREERGLTPETLAALAGISKPTVYLLERGGQRAQKETRNRLAAALGLASGEELLLPSPAVAKQDVASARMYFTAACQALRDELASDIRTNPAASCIRHLDATEAIRAMTAALRTRRENTEVARRRQVLHELSQRPGPNRARPPQ